MKKCNICQEFKNLYEFCKNKQSKDGLNYKCRNCISKYYENNKTKIKTTAKIWQEKNREDRLIKAKNYRYNNKEKIYETIKNWRKRNPEKQKIANDKWRNAHRDKYREINREFAKNNKGKMTAKVCKRYAFKKQALPKWLTIEQLEEIKQIYIKCSEITKRTGIKHEVDHIIPLQSDVVCGLHVPWNLQILTRKENIEKSNKLCSVNP